METQGLEGHFGVLFGPKPASFLLQSVLLYEHMYSDNNSTSMDNLLDLLNRTRTA